MARIPVAAEVAVEAADAVAAERCLSKLINERKENPMKHIYTHIEYSRVGHYQAVLEEKGIQTLVKNKDAAIGMGEIPVVEIWPELWVVNDEDFEKAVEILKELNDVLERKIEPWVCQNCGKTVEYGFGECWNCGTLKAEESEEVS